MSSLNINIVSNADEVIQLITDRLNDIDIKEMTAIQASTIMAEMRKRIHVEGKDSAGGKIGNYSESYMKVRTGLYGDAKVAKKGKSKGVVKSAGVYSKGSSKGAQRTKFQRGSDTKVILSLTRQMESDMVIVPFEKGCGIGYTNEANFKKSQYNEITYNKKIFNLTKKEREIIYDLGQEYINEKLK